MTMSGLPGRRESCVLAALAEVERARAERWKGFAGESLEPKLQQLEEKLKAALDEVRAGEQLETARMKGLVHWVADWIPDIDDPLLEAIYEVQRCTEEGLG
jgi:hypothetical protein